MDHATLQEPWVEFRTAATVHDPRQRLSLQTARTHQTLIHDSEDIHSLPHVIAFLKGERAALLQQRLEGAA